METTLKSPVLFLVFNRPEKTQKVFDIVKKVKPTKLYVAADAPRKNNPSDILLCEKVREIVQDVDWECETHFLFHDKNLGCSLAGKTAWDWFFSQEEEMIFIEDDGVPSLSFFYFCQELLEKFRDNNQIAYIGGINYGPKYGDATYFFTKQGVSTWGMATWKRVYDLYEYQLESYPTICNTKQFKKNFISSFEYQLWKKNFDNYITSIRRGVQPNTYDLQMAYLIKKYNMTCVFPNINMVSNIGFDMQGSNTKVNLDHPIALRFANKPVFEIEKIIHPTSIYIDLKFEINEMFKERRLGNQPIWKAKYKFYLRHILYKMPIVYKLLKSIRKNK